MAQFGDLPSVAYCLIARALPVSDALRARLVCRSWSQLFSLKPVRVVASQGLNWRACKDAFPDLQQFTVPATVSQAAASQATRQQQTSASAERGPAAAHSADEGARLQACDCALCNVAALSAVSRIPGARLIADGPFVDACSACATAQGSGQCLPAASAQGSPSLRSVTIEGLPVPDLLPLVEAVAQHYPGLQSLQITPDKQPAPASAQTAQRTQSQSYNTPERVSGLLASLPALSSLRHLRCIAPQTSLEVEVPAVWPAGTVSAHLSVRDPRYYVEQLAAMQTWIRQGCQLPAEISTPTGQPLRARHTIPATALLLVLTPTLHSLTLDSEVELSDPWVSACLASLTSLTTLHCRPFVTGPSHLWSLVQLTGLTQLTLDFGSEWWIAAEDLSALHSLTRLTRLALRVDYGLSGDEHEDEMRLQDHKQDDWSVIPHTLPALQHFTLKLKHADAGLALESLHRHHQAQQTASPRLSRAASPHRLNITLHLDEPLYPGLTLAPVCSHITELHLHASDPRGLLLTPANIRQLAGFTALRALHVAATLIPGSDPLCVHGAYAGSDPWPSVRDVDVSLQDLWTEAWPGRPLPERNAMLGAADWPGNPLLLLANLIQLHTLVMHVGCSSKAGFDSDSDEQGGGRELYQPEEAGEWFMLHAEGALEGDERDSDGDAAAPTDQHAASGPATSLNEALLQQYPVAKQWVDQAGTANQTDTVKQAGTDTQHRVQSLELSCAGLTDTVVAAWLAHMRGLEQLSLAGHGWFDSQAAAAAAASHLPAAAATTTDQQQCRGQGHLLDTVHGSGVDDSQMQTGSEETMAVKSALSALGSHRLLRSLQLSLSGVSPAVSPKPSVSVGGQSARQHTAAVSQQQGQAGSSVQAPLRGSIGTAAGRSTGHSTHSMARSPYGLSGTSFEYLSSTPPVGLLHLPWMRGGAHTSDGVVCASSHPGQPLLSVGEHLTIAPQHIPYSLDTLELHNVRFSRDWESDVKSPARPLLRSLCLTNTQPMRPGQPSLTPSTQQNPQEDQPAPNKATETQDAGDGSGTVWELPRTTLGNWHLKFVVGRMPMLTRLVWRDTLDTPTQEWAEIPSSGKLKSRAVALLSQLKDLTHLDFQVAHRMAWQAQEALAFALRDLPCLRSADIGATNLYKDTFFLLHPLKQLTSLQLRRSYQLTQEECEEQRSLLQSALQFCAPLTIA